jgi:hypothetical protein
MDPSSSRVFRVSSRIQFHPSPLVPARTNENALFVTVLFIPIHQHTNTRVREPSPFSLSFSLCGTAVSLQC